MSYYPRYESPYWKTIRQYLTMGVCGHQTSKAYSRAHGGLCKKCAAGKAPLKPMRASDHYGFRDPGEVRMGA